MHITAQDGTVFEAVAGTPSLPPPRFGLCGPTVMVGPYRDGDEHERHWLETIGSGTWFHAEWDEIRFGADDRELRSLWWHVTEENWSDGPGDWVELDPEPAVLRLVEPTVFQLPPTRHRWCPPSGSVLVCVGDEQPGKSASLRRIRVATDLDLLVADGRLLGWALNEPARWLSNGWDFPAETMPGPGVGEALALVLHTVTMQAVELMEDQDGGMLDRLRSLRQRVESIAGDSTRAAVLTGCVDDVIDNFYD